MNILFGLGTVITGFVMVVSGYKNKVATAPTQDIKALALELKNMKLPPTSPSIPSKLKTGASIPNNKKMSFEGKVTMGGGIAAIATGLTMTILAAHNEVSAGKGFLTGLDTSSLENIDKRCKANINILEQTIKSQQSLQTLKNNINQIKQRLCNEKKVCNEW